LAAGGPPPAGELLTGNIGSLRELAATKSASRSLQGSVPQYKILCCVLNSRSCAAVAEGDGQSGASLWAIVYCVGAVWLWLWLWLWLCGVWLASAPLTALSAPQSLQSPVLYLANNWEVISYQEIRKLAVGHDARRICKISCRMHSCTGPQLLLACEWRDAFVETSVRLQALRMMHRISAGYRCTATKPRQSTTC
jgi:hypothetical protein